MRRLLLALAALLACSPAWADGHIIKWDRFEGVHFQADDFGCVGGAASGVYICPGRPRSSGPGQAILNLRTGLLRASLMNQLQSGLLALSIRFFFTSAMRRDVDGGLKIAQDALCEGLGVNDNRIVETHLYKCVDKIHPRIEVTLSLVPASPDHDAASR